MPSDKPFLPRVTQDTTLPSETRNPFREFANDLFVANLLSLLVYALVELMRPGAISAVVNLSVWFLLTAIFSVGFVIFPRYSADLPRGKVRSVCFLVAFLVGGILLVVTSTTLLVGII